MKIQQSFLNFGAVSRVAEIRHLHISLDEVVEFCKLRSPTGESVIDRQRARKPWLGTRDGFHFHMQVYGLSGIEAFLGLGEQISLELVERQGVGITVRIAVASVLEHVLSE
ncbi:hypothetical protein AAur_0958 [Paenarthrobacter aurescens TC1]|uniref:Uncharacterized protein n=1 Tax=Paenarthrobacter aurescens (strain TC1) TaxID=290340 RepID=A1R3D6_PAEAT|nr:hypothetical protein AAur_0958 [Paenarthrobacter aurescens TC1]